LDSCGETRWSSRWPASAHFQHVILKHAIAEKTSEAQTYGQVAESILTAVTFIV